MKMTIRGYALMLNMDWLLIHQNFDIAFRTVQTTVSAAPYPLPGVLLFTFSFHPTPIP